MICDENTNESCLIWNLCNPITFIICTTQGDQNTWGYSASTIDPTAFIIDALSVIIWTTCWCPTSPMTFRNKSEMKCLSLYSLVPSMDSIKSGYFSDVAIKLISSLFCTSVHPSLTMLKLFSFQVSLINFNNFSICVLSFCNKVVFNLL